MNLPYYLTKLLPIFAMPLALGIFAALIALLLLMRRKRIAAIIALSCSIAVLWVSSVPVVADRLIWSLQRLYVPLSSSDIPDADCAVVLGGVVGRVALPRATIDLYDSIDRVYRAAALYREGKAQRIIVAAGNQPWAAGAEPEANIIRDLLIEWGVAPGAIALDTTSRNTRENALNASVLIREAGCQSTLLVTSSLHMPRAIASFAAVGEVVFPVSVDVKFSDTGGGPISRFIPQADALGISSLAIREWIGIWVYRWKGWN